MSKSKQPVAVAYSYLRFSHPDQARGDSLRRQTQLCDAWLQKNSLTLDVSLSLQDKGVSGFTGEHRNNPDRHALAAFLALVKQGRIPKGSFLIVENLDRLSREDIIPALSLALDLITRGIRIVQLLPAEMIYDQNANPMQVMMMIMELSRGHSESQMKSECVGAAWRHKKQVDARAGKPITAAAPAWLRLVEGRWQLIESAAAAVRRIYQLARDGYGLTVIAGTLNREGVPPIGGRAGHWSRRYIDKILGNRAVLGEYQPRRGRGAKSKPDGEPIPGYYPAVLREEEYYAARQALAGRRHKGGRPVKGRSHLFAGLLHDALAGGSLVLKQIRQSGHYLKSYKGMQGLPGPHCAGFPLAMFEAAVLTLLREVDPRELLPGNGHEEKALALAGRLAEVEAEIERVKQRLQARYSDAVADVLERHETNQRALAEELAQARREAASPLGEAWGECQSLVQALDAAPDPEHARVRLRAALRRIVEGVWCVFIAAQQNQARLAAVQLWFTGGAHRDYLLLHLPAQGGRACRRQARCYVSTLTGLAGSAHLDLRRRDHAQRLEKQLTTVDSAQLEQLDGARLLVGGAE